MSSLSLWVVSGSSSSSATVLSWGKWPAHHILKLSTSFYVRRNIATWWLNKNIIQGSATNLTVIENFGFISVNNISCSHWCSTLWWIELENSFKSKFIGFSKRSRDLVSDIDTEGQSTVWKQPPERVLSCLYSPLSAFLWQRERHFVKIRVWRLIRQVIMASRSQGQGEFINSVNRLRGGLISPALAISSTSQSGECCNLYHYFKLFWQF